MGLLRYRETGEVVTETEFRFRTRKRRPHNVPAQGLLTVEFLDSEGIDPVLNGPGTIETYEVTLESELDKALLEVALNPYSDKTFSVHILLEDGGCVEYETSSQLLTQDDDNIILQSNFGYEQINGKWFTSIKHEY
jgi:hypothetical protein